MNSSDLTPDRLIEAIGVRDLEDGETYVSEHPAAASGGLLVRGAAAGGSPVLNFATHGILVLAVLLLVGLGYGAWRLLGSDGSSSPPTVTSAGLFECKVRFWHGAPSGILAAAPNVAAGALGMPREPSELAAARGETFAVGQDRVDRFSPDGAQLAVRYAGAGLQVRSVSVSFAEPLERCRALRTVGVVTETAVFRIDGDGVLSVVSGTPHPLQARGGLIRAQLEGERISVLQFDAPLH